MADAVPEPEGFRFRRQGLAIQAPEGGDPVEIRIRRPRARKYTLESRRVGGERTEPDMDIGGSERLLPMLGALSPTSPNCAARAAMPCWNGRGKLSRSPAEHRAP